MSVEQNNKNIPSAIGPHGTPKDLFIPEPCEWGSCDGLAKLDNKTCDTCCYGKGEYCANPFRLLATFERAGEVWRECIRPRVWLEEPVIDDPLLQYSWEKMMVPSLDDNSERFIISLWFD